MVFRKLTDEHGDWLCTDTHRWPIMVWRSENMGDIEGVPPHYFRQALLRVESGWDISVIWGSMTYSDNHDHPYGDWRTREVTEFHEEPALVEVALTQPDHDGVVGGDVWGYATEEQFAAFMVKVSVLPRFWNGDINDLVSDRAAEEYESSENSYKEQPT